MFAAAKGVRVTCRARARGRFAAQASGIANGCVAGEAFRRLRNCTRKRSREMGCDFIAGPLRSPFRPTREHRGVYPREGAARDRPTRWFEAARLQLRAVCCPNVSEPKSNWALGEK
jgi:hypothetical protein